MYVSLSFCCIKCAIIVRGLSFTNLENNIEGIEETDKEDDILAEEGLQFIAEAADPESWADIRNCCANENDSLENCDILEDLDILEDDEMADFLEDSRDNEPHSIQENVKTRIIRYLFSTLPFCSEDIDMEKHTFLSSLQSADNHLMETFENWGLMGRLVQLCPAIRKCDDMPKLILTERP